MKILIFIYFMFLPFLQAKIDPEFLEKNQNAKQPSVKIFAAIGIKEGMNVGEIGAGKGRYTVELSKRVGNSGRIYASDIDIKALEELKTRYQKEKLSNIDILLATETNPNFPNGTLDVVFMINTYHHIVKPIEVLKNIVPSLKSTSILAIVEHDQKRFFNQAHTTPKEVLIEQAQIAGFELVRLEDFLKEDYIYIFKLKKNKSLVH